MKILAIETSCDDTCAAVLEDDKVLSSVISSQVMFHKKYGGVMPSVAREKHKEFINPTVEKALKTAKVKLEDIDVLAVTYGPGLAIALEVGIEKIKQLHKKTKKQVVAVNHLEGHLLSPFLKNKNGKYYAKNIVKFPFLSLVVSGGHTEIVLVKGIGQYELVGQTLDDAAGEAFDKVARLLKLGYPGGPLISKIAEGGDIKKYDLPRCLEYSKDFNFSFSGLKTASLNTLRKEYEKKERKEAKNISFQQSVDYYDSKDMFFSKKEMSDFAASFEFAVVDILTKKVKSAIKKYGVKYVAIGGGVSANLTLRKHLRKEMKKLGVKVSMPETKFCTDNAGMIGLVAYHKAKRKEFLKKPMELDREPVLNFE
jgi:N6-L-threonylcarbamoyladenine synthase